MVEATPGTLLYLALILLAVLGVPPSFYAAQPEQQEVVKRFGADVGTAFYYGIFTNAGQLKAWHNGIFIQLLTLPPAAT